MNEFLFYFKKCLKNYANFKGRARRKEFWMFFAVNTAISTILNMLGGFININLGDTAFSMGYSLIVLIPSIAVGVRRLHDIGKSGWLYLLFLIPIVGWIILIIWACKEGVVGENQYGPDPKEIYEFIA